MAENICGRYCKYMTKMKQNDKELRNALLHLYEVERGDTFVEKTLQCLPSRGKQRLWLILGNVAIWSAVLSLAVIYFPEIVYATAELIAMLSVRQMPDNDVFVMLVLCAVVLYVAVIYSMELIDNYYRSPLSDKLSDEF